MNRDDLELYVMGMYEGDVAALERELAGDDAARAIVAGEARLEMVLRDAAAVATFCPACDDLVRGTRCDACGAAVRPGGYVVERVLVSNAHGRMYVARDADGKQVALKELAFVQSPTLSAIAAFEREAKFLRALEHPAIPRFCASFEEGTGVHARYYLAQELVVGEALDGRLEGHWFTEVEIRGIARQVLDVLVYLQGLSPMVIHRDIKPANLLVRPDGTIAVVDFGAAHVHGMTAGLTTIGTFGYMPIEQLAGVVDATTDPYALGASLIQLLTRREPWRVLQGGTLAGVELNVSRPMRAFLAKLVAPAHGDRFASAASARAALDRMVPAQRAARVSRPTPRWLARPALLAAVAGVLAVSGGGIAFRASHLAHHRSRPAGLTSPRPQSAGSSETPDSILQEMAALADEACGCNERGCAETVSERIGTWGREMSRVRWDGPYGSMRPEIVKQIRRQSERMTECLTRVMTESATSAIFSLVHAGAGEDKVVHLPSDGLAVEDAARVIAGACAMNVVVAERATAWVGAGLSAIQCDHVLETVLRPTDLAYERDGDIARIVRRDDLAAEHAARDNRARRGIIEDRIPPGSQIDLDLRQTPVRDVIQRLARSGGIKLAIPDAIAGSVTVRVTHAAWDRVLVAVLDASGLGYRYAAAGNQLRIAPIAEIDAERERMTPSGHLDIRYRGDAQIEIDGVATEWRPGKPLELAPGSHQITLAKPSGDRSIYRVELTPGTTTRIEIAD